ncbi:MAG: nickel-dependent hydrogenase large subunit [Armatimonadetes bacterium]|nr:nickel-dependent hydrogenase large subunit [Candidatus Hippobium faecium]
MKNNSETPRSLVPFGPQHPVLPEPIHIKLVLEDEKIVEAVPAIGYVHRGLEKLTETKDMYKSIFVLERICGICSFMHAMCYCQGVEELTETEVPDRAKYLRVIWGELHRTHTHLLWLGLFADAFGFESLFYECWRIREKILDIMEATAGARVIISSNTIGGTRRDISPEMLEHIRKTTYEIEEAMDYIEKVFLDDPTVLTRTVGVGVLSKDDAYLYGAVGPTGRGSGLNQDLRMTGYAAYGDLDFEPIAETAGDCNARCKVRIRELYQSQKLLRQAIEKIPEGEIVAKVTKKPIGETVSRVEQPRGECMYYIRGNGTDILERVRVRTPTFANIPALVAMLPGHQLYDLPVLILSIDPCISCTER